MDDLEAEMPLGLANSALEVLKVVPGTLRLNFEATFCVVGAINQLARSMVQQCDRGLGASSG